MKYGIAHGTPETASVPVLTVSESVKDTSDHCCSNAVVSLLDRLKCQTKL